MLREFQLKGSDGWRSGGRPTLKEAAVWIFKLCRMAVGGIVIKTGYDYLQTDLLTSLFVMAVGVYFVFSTLVLKDTD